MARATMVKANRVIELQVKAKGQAQTSHDEARSQAGSVLHAADGVSVVAVGVGRVEGLGCPGRVPQGRFAGT